MGRRQLLGLRRRAQANRAAFTAPGSYRYSCTLHIGMNGRVDVGTGTTP